MTLSLTTRSGVGRALTWTEGDANWSAIQSAVNGLLALSPGVGISTINQPTPTTLTVTLTNTTVLGPFTLPMGIYNYRGPWTASTAYAVNDTFQFNGTLYDVLVAHTSATTFSPTATDGLGHNLYQALLSSPANVLPTGGTAGQFLAKNSSTDFDIAWVSRNSVSSQTASYTLVLTDAFTTKLLGSSSAITCTVPPNSSVAFAIGTKIKLAQNNVGALSVVAGSGVTINAPQGLVFGRQYLAANLEKTASDTWLLTFEGIPAKAPKVLYDNGNVSGSFTVNLANGESQIVTLTGNATLAITGWDSGFSALSLKIKYSGAYTLTPPTAKWSNGSAPSAAGTSGKWDRHIYSTDDSGVTIEGNVVGQNYA